MSSLDSGCVIHTTPFKCCFLPNLISDEDFLKNLEKDLLQLKFFEKSNDLYKFHQVNECYNPFELTKIFIELLIITDYNEIII